MRGIRYGYDDDDDDDDDYDGYEGATAIRCLDIAIILVEVSRTMYLFIIITRFGVTVTQ